MSHHFASAKRRTLPYWEAQNTGMQAEALLATGDKEVWQELARRNQEEEAQAGQKVISAELVDVILAVAPMLPEGDLATFAANLGRAFFRMTQESQLPEAA
jgi:hypothetical protein